MHLFAFLNRLKVQVSDDQRYIDVDYNPGSPDALYDICDVNGRIIKTGKIDRDSMRVAVSDLLNSAYVFLVLDGDRIRTQRFTIHR